MANKNLIVGTTKVGADYATGQVKALDNGDGSITPSVILDSVANAGLPAITPGTSSKTAYTGTSAQSGALTATLVRVVSSTDCHLAFAASPTAVADGTGVFLPANVPEYFKVTSGNKIAAIQDASAGNLFVTVAA